MSQTVNSLTEDINWLSESKYVSYASEFTSYKSQHMGNVTSHSNYTGSSTFMFQHSATLNSPFIYSSVSLPSPGGQSLSGHDHIYLTHPGRYTVDMYMYVTTDDTSNNKALVAGHWMECNGSKSDSILLDSVGGLGDAILNQHYKWNLPSSHSTCTFYYNFITHSNYIFTPTTSSLTPTSISSVKVGFQYVGAS